MKTVIIAIDPGASGGLAQLEENKPAYAIPLPDDDDLRGYLEGADACSAMEGARLVVYVEQVGGYVGGKGQPGSAMFNFGEGCGYIRGLLSALRIETRYVRPQAWQKGIPGVQGAGSKQLRKRALKEHAARIFPGLKVTLKTADALCIADYARRMEGGK